MKLEEIKNQLPPLFARSEVDRWFKGIIATGTLANLASRGQGPRYTKKGRKIFYLRDDLLRWLEENSQSINTVEQQWTEGSSDADTRIA